MTDRQSTHADGCWSWGQEHYECAVREIERNEALLRQALDALNHVSAQDRVQIIASLRERLNRKEPQ